MIFRTDEDAHFRQEMYCPTHGIAIERGNVCEACHNGLPPTQGLTMALFDARNKKRCEEMAQALDGWKPWEWTNAMAGECGEACNITKKMSRMWPANQFRQAWNKPEDQRMEDLNQRLKREIGDVMIYASLLAQERGWSMEECIRAAFNEKSQEIGSDITV